MGDRTGSPERHHAHPIEGKSSPRNNLECVVYPVAEETYFSVIIPTYERTDQLEDALSCLLRQTVGCGRFEVLLCDDGSRKESYARLQGLVAKLPSSLNLKLLRNSHQKGPACARNRAAFVACGSHLVFLDDDCRPDCDWLEQFARVFKSSPPKTLLGGKTTNPRPEDLPAEIGEMILDVGLRTFAPVPGSMYFHRTNNMAVPRDLFLELGGFDVRFRTAEDREFCDRWQAKGGRLEYARAAKVAHDSPLNLRTFARRHFCYGRGAFLFHRHRLHRQTAKRDRTFLIYYARVFREAWRTSPRPWSAIGLLLVWQFANLLGFLREWLHPSFQEGDEPLASAGSGLLLPTVPPAR